MKITDLKCAIIGDNPIVRIKTDAGIDGLGQAEWTKPYLKPFVLYYKRCDPRPRPDRCRARRQPHP